MMYCILSLDYYVKSIRYILDKNSSLKKIWVFCEKDDFESIDKQQVKYLKSVFPSLTFEYASFEMEDWEQMIFMSLCSNNVIANSSFSWWGAYMNTDLHKIVCYPEKWFGPAVSHNTKDLCPDWIRIV